MWHHLFHLGESCPKLDTIYWACIRKTVWRNYMNSLKFAMKTTYFIKEIKSRKNNNKREIPQPLFVTISSLCRKTIKWQSGKQLHNKLDPYTKS